MSHRSFVIFQRESIVSEWVWVCTAQATIRQLYIHMAAIVEEKDVFV